MHKIAARYMFSSVKRFVVEPENHGASIASACRFLFRSTCCHRGPRVLDRHSCLPKALRESMQIEKTERVQAPEQRLSDGVSQLFSRRICGHILALAITILLFLLLLYPPSTIGRGNMADDEGVDWILSNLATNHGAIEYRDFGHDYMPINSISWE